MRWIPVLTAACTLLGCADPEPEPIDETLVALSPTDQLTRVSMALRGTRPSMADYQAILQDPDALPSLVDTYLDSPEFGATVRDLYAEVLLMRSPFVPPPVSLICLTAHQKTQISASLGLTSMQMHPKHRKKGPRN